MAIIYTEEQRAQIISDAKDKTVYELEWTNPQDGMPGYWTMVFTDGSEISFRFMSELI